MRTLLSLALAAALLPTLAGCDSGDGGTEAGTFYGLPTEIGHGQARTFVRLDDEGDPEAVGVVLSADALHGLPEHGDHTGNSTVLGLPAQAAGVPFKHLSLDWNPMGHGGPFTAPHFDFHFYTVREIERGTWTPEDPAFMEKGLRQPEARYIPEGFIADPSGHVVPTMGLHWLDAGDPTYAPGGPAFSEGFIWGSYDGRMVFAEPMITTDFLASRPNHSEALAQPAAFAEAGYYPTRYTVRYDAGQDAYVIALEGLTYREAG